MDERRPRNDLYCLSSDDISRYSCPRNGPKFCAVQRCSWVCSLCEISETRIKKGRGHAQVYPCKQKMKSRTLKRTKRHAAYAIETDAPHRGVKGWSPFANNYNFDHVEGCVFDAMHVIYLGVTRQLSKLWFPMVYWHPNTYCYNR